MAEWVSEGMQVFTMVKGKRLLCVVLVACGNLARVVNELHGVDVWRHVRELEVA